MRAGGQRKQSKTKFKPKKGKQHKKGMPSKSTESMGMLAALHLPTYDRPNFDTSI